MTSHDPRGPAAAARPRGPRRALGSAALASLLVLGAHAPATHAQSPRARAPVAPAGLTPESVLAPFPSTQGAQSPAPGSSVTSTDVPPYWQTWAERTGYRQTSDHDATMRYVRQIEAGSRWVKVEIFGRSAQGRELPLVIVSKDRAFTPEAARATGKPVVLVQCGIHAGEIEGKDAMLALVRDMAVLRTRAHLLDSAIVLVVPVFSADAHDRRGRFHRINQNGPEEMGWRATALGLNLNRDYVKAETPEMRAFLAGVWTRWMPHLLVDTHTTNGADYRHDLTYAFNHGPGVAPAVRAWLLEAFEGRVLERCRDRGHLTAPYLWFRDDPSRPGGVDFGDAPPRLSNGFAAMHGRPGVLVETHMLKPYWLRVKATFDLALALLEELRDHPRALTDAVREAEAAAVARGRASDPAARTVALETATTDTPTPFRYLGWRHTLERSDITGSLVPRYTAEPWDTTISVYREVVATRTLTLPAGYLVPQEWSVARDRLDLHGARWQRLARAWRDTVEQTRVLRFRHGELREGRRPTEVESLVVERVVRAFRPGDLWVPLDQPAAMAAVHLLDPASREGLLHWGAFDGVLTQKEYGEAYVVEPMARRMLEADPALRAEFEAALRDPAFARSEWARVNFFYTRSPWADPEQGVVPVFRASRAPGAGALAP
uniref:Peptidase M14 n=1 Tax=Eiseniibacteriota bacterium TaxID=2212470 RepID=A0A832MK83_UNCEI